MFRAYGQFVGPTDFVTFASAPGVAWAAMSGTAGTFGVTMAVVFLLSLGCAWLLPREARPLRGRHAAVIVPLLVAEVARRVVPACVANPRALGAGIPLLPGRAAQATYHACPGARSAEHPSRHVGVAAERGARPRRVARREPPELLRLWARHVPAPRAALRRGHAARHARRHRDGPKHAHKPAVHLDGPRRPDAGDRVFAAPTVLEYAKARGYHTAFISAQKSRGGASTSSFAPAPTSSAPASPSHRAWTYVRRGRPRRARATRAPAPRADRGAILRRAPHEGATRPTRTIRARPARCSCRRTASTR